MANPYRLPTAKVMAADFADDVARLTVEVSQQDYLKYPIAPADLRRSDPHQMVFPSVGRRW